MGATTEISWADATFNPWRGCTKVSPACTNCYADRMSKRNPGTLGIWGPNGTRVKASEEMWGKPSKWNAEAKAAGERRRVFCSSLADVFEDWQGPIVDNNGETVRWDATLEGPSKWRMMAGGEGVPVCMNDLRIRLFELIESTPHLDWLLLTKRPENIRRLWPRAGYPDAGVAGTLGRRLRYSNVWLGTSVENQEQADKRIPELLCCRELSPVLFLSCEPLLGPVELRRIRSWHPVHGPEGSDALLGGSWGHDFVRGMAGDPDCPGYCNHSDAPTINWVIAGGESGPQARPSHPDWFRSLRDQCVESQVPFHFKQWGEWRPKLTSIAGEPRPVCSDGSRWGVLDREGTWHASTTPWNGREDADSDTGEVTMVRVGTKHSGRELDGRTWDELPTGGRDAKHRL